jgi:hypothetical protein
LDWYDSGHAHARHAASHGSGACGKAKEDGRGTHFDRGLVSLLVWVEKFKFMEWRRSGKRVMEEECDRI